MLILGQKLRIYSNLSWEIGFLRDVSKTRSLIEPVCCQARTCVLLPSVDEAPVVPGHHGALHLAAAAHALRVPVAGQSEVSIEAR